MANGKLEGALHIPDAGWAIAVTDGVGGPTAVTVPGGGYRYLSVSGDLTDGLVLELQQQLNATMSDTFSVSLSVTTGKVTITNSTAPGGTTITWTNTDIRDALGFSQGNLSGADTYTGDDQARGLWLPDAPFTKDNSGNWAGYHETDYQVSEAPDGSTFALMGSRKTILPLRWDAISQAKVWADNEVTVNESFERFVIDCVYGEASFGQAGGPVTFFPDETDDATYNEYRVGAGLEDFRPRQRLENYAAVWSIELPRLVKLPG